MIIYDYKTFEKQFNSINEDIDLDDIKSSVFGNKKKIKTPEGIKVKVKGQSISKEELSGFFNTIKTYLTIVPFDKLKKEDKELRGKETTEKDIELTYDKRGLVDKIIDKTGKKGSSIDIDYGGGRVVFKRKEGQGTDKIKLILEPRFLRNTDNSQLLDELIDDVIIKDELSDELSNNYDTEHDNEKVKGEEVTETEREEKYKEEEKVVSDKENTESEKVVLVPEVANRQVARKISDVLLSQRLYVYTADTDEDAIFELFTEGDQPLLLDCNSATIDLACELYLNAPKPIGASTTNLKRDDSTDTVSDKIVGFSDWALKSTGINTYKSNGIVSDLLYAFDSLDNNKASSAVISGLNVMDSGTTKGINSHLGELGLAIAGGAIVATGIKGARVSKKLMGKTASLSRLASRKASTGGIKSLLGKFGSKLFGTGSKVLGVVGILGRCIGWVGLAITVYEGLSWWRGYSVESQAAQVTKILYLMQFSGSQKFKEELKKVGIETNLLDAEQLKKSASEIEIPTEE